jgi:transcriptional regulator with XRE-family HTH domain
MVIGANIRKERMLKGYSQEWLATKLKISQNVISDIENGKVDVKMGKLEEIANVLEIDPFKLIEFEKAFYNTSNNSLGDNSILKNGTDNDELINVYQELIASLKNEIKAKDELITLLKK